MVKEKRMRSKLQSLPKKKRFMNITKNEEDIRREMEESSPSDVKNTKSGTSVAGDTLLSDRITSDAASVYDMDRMSTVTGLSTASRGAHRTKLARAVDKRQLILHKILDSENKIHKAKDRRSKKNNNKKKLAVVGDLSALTEALPTLEFLKAETSAKEAKAQYEAKSMKQEHLQKRMLDDMSMFLAIAQHKEYQDDMFNIVSQSIHEQVKVKDPRKLTKRKKRRSKKK